MSGVWHGIADFLERIDRPSALGDWSYQVLDTKLARHPRPEHALQLCFYSHAVEQIQGIAPEMAYVVLGTRDRFPIRLANVSAYFRRLQGRFHEAIAARRKTAPYPCEHCPMCSYAAICSARWESEDHLVRVAGIRRDQVNRLTGVGLTTLTALAQARPDTRVPKIPSATFEALHSQAALQLETLRIGRIAYCELPVEDGRGFAVLPQRSRGDIILDLEGHPFFEPARGLTFLFGIIILDEDRPRYRPFWAHDFAGERRAFEEFIDFVHARLNEYPDFHVYHYGAYEQSAIKQLMGLYATREAEVDELLRRKTFVNLFSIFRQSLRAGVSSYSLKKLEPLFGFTRVGAVGSGMEAIVEYERWRASQEHRFLEQIAAYNEADCRSTLLLLGWLHKLRPSEVPWPALPEPQAISEEAAEILDARQRLREELVTSAEAGEYPWLAGELLEYHRREARPAWWWYFERCGMTPEELVEDAESIGCLEAEESASPIPRKRTLIYTLKFPPQDHKLALGAAHDPATGKGAGEILEIDDTTGMLKLLRGPKLAGTALPEALIAGGPYRDHDQRMALFRLAESIQKGDRRYPALEAVLKRERPRIDGAELSTPLLPGFYYLTLINGDDRQIIREPALAVMRPFQEKLGSMLNGYRIGTYLAERFRGSEEKDHPDGFLEIFPQHLDLARRVFPDFGAASYVVLDTRDVDVLSLALASPANASEMADLVVFLESLTGEVAPEVTLLHRRLGARDFAFDYMRPVMRHDVSRCEHVAIVHAQGMFM